MAKRGGRIDNANLLSLLHAWLSLERNVLFVEHIYL
jgi:hypothetical protein